MTVEIIGSCIAAVSLLVTLTASAHVVLYKRDSRAAIAWTGLIWLAPLVGTVLYVLLGINRIERRARKLRTGASGHRSSHSQCDRESPQQTLEVARNLKHLSQLVQKVTDFDLTFGNQIEPLSGGDQAYPAMLSAIRSARRTIGLSTYLFDADEVGFEFASALRDADRRGVEVRVLIDAVGAKYALKSIVRTLREFGVTVELFNTPLVPGRFRYANLRNHRKILTVDGKLAFTGGMNIRGCCVTSSKSAETVNDLHFRLQGPIVHHIQETFVADWQFATDEELNGEGWHPPLSAVGDTPARGIVAGPDESLDRLRLILLGACQCAGKSIRILTPYFLPDDALISALTVAALRGVSVEIFIPQVSNEKLVQWACDAQLWQLVNRGCHVRRIRPPFDHGKLVIVDDEWVLLGSANWDPRSLRLNFEFNVESYCQRLAARLNEILDQKKKLSVLVTPDELRQQSLLIRLRNGMTRLAAPFL